MKNPGTNYDIFNGVINDKVSEEMYFKDRTDSAGRLIIDMPELLYVRQRPSLLAEFLLSLSVEGRLKVLLTKEMIGMPQKNLIAKYGIPSDTIRKLKGQYKIKEKSSISEIRRIEPFGPVEYEILALIAIFTRIPISWLQQLKPHKETAWSNHHFLAFRDVRCSLEQFIKFLRKSEEDALFNEKHITHTRPAFPYMYDVKGIILIHNSKQIYLRTSFFEKGGFIVELFGQNDQLTDFTLMRKVLEPFGPILVGYCETVINNHINLMFVAKSKANELTLPVEFKTF